MRDAKAAIAELEREIEDARSAVSEAQRELEDCRGQIERLRGDGRTAEVSLDAEPTALGAAYERQLEELRETDAAVLEAAGSEREARSGRWTATEGVRLGYCFGWVEEGDGRAKESGDRNERATGRIRLGCRSRVQEVADLLEEETKRNSQLEELRDFADSVELAIDTAATGAALRQQRQAVRVRERRIEETEQDIERYESWRSYFEELGERVAGRQNAAIASFADEYGPTASAIQERLRSVYGFDGIDTRSHEATIRVRVRRGARFCDPRTILAIHNNGLCF